MDIQKIKDALTSYKGDMDSLDKFVAVAESELGDDWTLHIYADLKELPPNLKSKLDHAFNYHGATIAWNEIQGYLTSDHMNAAEAQERIPVLEYWLKFFGQAGTDVISQLKQKIQVEQETTGEGHQQVTPPAQQENAAQEPAEPAIEPVIPAVKKSENYKPTSPAEPKPIVQQEAPVENDMDVSKPESVAVEESEKSATRKSLIDDAFANDILDEPQYDDTPDEVSQMPVDDKDKYVPHSLLEEPSASYGSLIEEPNDLPVVSEASMPVVTQEIDAETPVQPAPKSDMVRPMPSSKPALNISKVGDQKTEKPRDPDLFLVDKISRQIEFLQQAQAWISARCVELDNIEPYKYPYYGFLMDVYQQTLKDIDVVLNDSKITAKVDPAMQKTLRDTQTTLKSELDFSKGLFDANPKPLLDEDVSGEDAKRILGGLDRSNAKEYLGPAPDGFEALDDPYQEDAQASQTPAEFDEDKIKSQYEEMESHEDVNMEQVSPVAEPVKRSAVRPQASASSMPQRGGEKSLANQPQKGVEKKVTVSLGVKPLRKKTTG